MSVIILQPSGKITTKSTLAAAAAAADVAGKTVIVSSPITLSSDLTWPTDRALNIVKGGVITVSNGVTLTINGPFNADKYQVFAGNGSVILNGESNATWFGASPTASAATNSASFLAAINSISASKGKISIDAGTYSYDTSLPLKEGVTIQGKGIGSTVLNYTGNAEALKTTDGSESYAICISSLSITGSSSATCGIRLGHPASSGGGESTGYCSLRDIWVSGFSASNAIGIWLDNPCNVTVDNARVYSVVNGYGFKISADGSNTGSILVSNVSSDAKIGVLIESVSSYVNSISINGSKFIGATQSVQITSGDSTSFTACKFETSAAVKPIYITNGVVSFRDCHIEGNSVATGVFDLPESTSNRRITVDNIEIFNMASGAYIFTCDPDSTNTLVNFGEWVSSGNTPTVSIGDTSATPQVRYIAIETKGTWTPTLTCDSGSISLNIATGYYVKTKNYFFVSIHFAVSSVSSPSGDLYVSIPDFGSILCDTPAQIYANNLTTSATTAMQGTVVSLTKKIVVTRFSAGSSVSCAATVKSTSQINISAIVLLD